MKKIDYLVGFLVIVFTALVVTKVYLKTQHANCPCCNEQHTKP